MRKLLVLLVVVGLLVAGDIWIKAEAEKRVATQVQSSFGPRGEAEVEFSGFPFIVRLAAGSIPSAKLTSTSLERSGVRLTDLRIAMQDVTFSWSKILAGEIGSVRVRDGHGRASIPGPDLVDAFDSQANLEIVVTDGKIRVRLGPQEASARLTLDGTNLVLRAPGLGFFKTALPSFIVGMQYRSVRISGSDVVVEFSLRGANFR